MICELGRYNMEIWKEIIVAVLKGALASGITFLGTYLLLKYNYKKLFAETISKSRNEWINQFRNEIITFLSLNDMFRTKGKIIDDEKEKEWHSKRNMLLMRLNQSEELHQKLYCQIQEISFPNELNDQEYLKLKNELMITAKSILKEEWERVKAEAKGVENQNKNSNKDHKQSIQ